MNYLCDRTPLKRPGRPDDLDGAVVFLASESSRDIIGRTLLVDGGISTVRQTQFSSQILQLDSRRTFPKRVVSPVRMIPTA